MYWLDLTKPSLQLLGGILLSAVILVISTLLLLSPSRPNRIEGRERKFTSIQNYLKATASSSSSAKKGKKKKAEVGEEEEEGEFPYMQKESSCDLSIVVPAYNEELRLPIMLEEALIWLLASKKSWEILVVDDGSKDQTTLTALNFGKNNAREITEANGDLRVLTLSKNRGKGGAVMQGILASQGSYILFADADGASKFSDIEKLLKEMEGLVKKKKKGSSGGLAFAVGSRAHMVSTDAVVKRSLIRNILMRCFHFAVYILGIQSIKDTQCGFKLLSRSAALLIAPAMHVQGWIFDIEMFILAGRYKVPVAEVAITWHEVDGSKMNLVNASVEMLVQLTMIRLNYLLGRW